MKKAIIDLVAKVAKKYGLDPFAFLSIISVETGGRGFDEDTGKILIQFEPHWFRRNEPYVPSGNWSLNKVDIQIREWPAFNSAYSIDPDSAMKSTSIGLGQIMGFHYERLGFKSVGDMWSDAKKGLENQIEQIAKFLISDKNLSLHFKNKDWHNIALIYNGKDYKKMAVKWGREPYNVSMQKAYNKFKSQYKFT